MQSFILNWKIVQFSSVAQSCPTLCNPMNRSVPGLPVHHLHLEFTQTHVHRVGDTIQPSHPLQSPSPPVPNPSQHQVPESSSSSQGISLKGWVVLVENDAASDSKCGTACLFQASGSLLYFDKSIRSEVWHFQFPLTQIYCLQKSLLSFRVPASAILSESALLSIIYFLLCVLYLTCDYILTHATFLSLFLIFLNPVCP